MAGTTLSFNILARDNASKTITGVSQRFGVLRVGIAKVGSGIGALGKTAAIGLGAMAVAAGAAAPKVLGAAANLDLVGKKSETVFGGQLGMVQKWAKTNANAMGLTSTQATGLAANFADLLIPMGFTREAASKMSTDVVGLSGALAEWSGGTKTAAEVSEILSAAMLGETDGLKSLGISISAADIEARLLAKGQNKLTGAARQQAEAQAVQQLIMEKSKDAQTAFANGQGTLARKLAESKARFREFGEELLTKATPALLKIVDSSQKFTGWISSKMQPVLLGLVGIFKAEVLPRLREFGGFLTGTVIPAVVGFGKKVVANVVPAVQNLVAAFTPLARDIAAKIPPVFNIAKSVIGSLAGVITGSILPAFKSFTGFLKNNSTLVGAVTVGIGAMVGAFYAYKFALGVVSVATKAFAAVQAALNVVMSLNPIGIVVLALVGLAAGLVYAYKKSETFRRIVDGAFKAVKTAVVGVVNFFKNLGPMIGKAVGTVTGLLTGKGKDIIWGLASGVYKNVTGLMKWWISLPVSILRWIGNVGASLVGKGKDFIWGLAKGVYNNVTGLVRWWAQLPGNVIRWIGDTTKTLGARGLGFITGLSRGIYNNLTGLARFWAQLPATVIRWIGDTTGILVSKGAGFLQGLWSGLMNKWIGVTKWIGGLKASASAWLGDTSKFLVGKGRDVLSGFWAGLKEKWGEVTKWVSGIATWIKDHKGPVSLDAKLLIPAGRAIMDGFLSGLKSGAGPAWNFVQSVGGKTVSALKAAIGGPFMGGGDPAPTNLSAMQALVRTLAAQRGWGSGSQWDALYNLIMGESGFNPNAQNPTSTAYGMFQFLNSTWATVGASKTSDPWGQTIAGLRYIANNYGSPANAYAKWSSRSPHWYKQGTPWVPDDQLAFLHKGEAVVPADVNRARLAGAGSVQPIVINVNGALDPTAVAEQIRQILKRYKKNLGGGELGLA